MMNIEEIKEAIKNFIDEYWGSEEGEYVYHKRINISDRNHDDIKHLYEEMISRGWI